MSVRVPYTVTVAHPDWKRPYLEIDYVQNLSDTLALKYLNAMYAAGFDTEEKLLKKCWINSLTTIGVMDIWRINQSVLSILFLIQI